MAKAVVLLFLLDTLPDPHLSGISCDPRIAGPVIQVLSKKLGLSADSIERIINLEKGSNLKRGPELQESTELRNDVGTSIDNSIQGSNENSLEKTNNNNEHDVARTVDEEDISDCEMQTDIFRFNGSSNDNNALFPERAPFLAAIFETVANVTAQTCGGALLSPHWVITAASCVNVLGPFYSNSSNQTLDNSYTIVINATNPLKDGTVHNVSEIILHPTPKVIANPPRQYSLLHQNQALIRQLFNIKLMPVVNVKAPSLALMRIEPGAEGGMVGVIGKSTNWDGWNARVYGWALMQNKSGHDVMLASSLPLRVLTPGKCRSVYGIMEHNSTLCLSMNETAGNITRMNSGGPVVVMQEGQAQLMSVALTDGTAPLLASPLSMHRDWLRKVIGTAV